MSYVSALQLAMGEGPHLSADWQGSEELSQSYGRAPGACNGCLLCNLPAGIIGHPAACHILCRASCDHQL